MQFMAPLTTHIRGRHAAPDNLILVTDENGKRSAIENRDTRIHPDATVVHFASACEGTVCLRVEDTKHSDFWIEFNLDIATLKQLLAEAERTVSETGQ